MHIIALPESKAILLAGNILICYDILWCDMNEFLEKKYQLRTLDFDRYYNIRPSSILDLFQDCAGAHTAIFNCDRDNIIKQGLFWVLVNVKFETLKNPDPKKDVIVKTWPIRSNGVRYIRNFQIMNEERELLVRGTSCWTILDFNTRRIVLKAKVFPDDMVYLEENVFEEKLAKIEDFKPTAALKTLKPEFSDLDFNEHVNNAKYADFIVNAIYDGTNRPIKSFQIDFHKEIRYGEDIMLFSGEDGNATKVKGVSQDGETKFISKIIFN